MSEDIIGTVSREEAKQLGVEIAELCVTSGLSKSKSEARRMILQGAVRINDKQIKDQNARLIKGPGENEFIVIDSTEKV